MAQATEKGQETPIKVSKKTYKYRCICKCYYNQQLFEEGAILTSEVEIKDIPTHCFKPAN